MKVIRRTALGGLCPTSVHTLLTRRLSGLAPGAPSMQQAAAAGSLMLMLTAITSRSLRISIAPADEPPRLEELGTINSPRPSTLRDSARASNESVKWGRFRIHVKTDPLQIAVYDGNALRQEVRFDLDRTNIKFNLEVQFLV